MQTQSKYHVAVFLTVAFGLGYVIWIVAYLLYNVFNVLSLTGFLLATVIPMLAPALGALAVKLLQQREAARVGSHPEPSPGKTVPRPAIWTRLALAVRYSTLGIATMAVVLLVSGVAGVGLLTRWLGKPIDWSPFPSLLAAWCACLPVWIPLVLLEEVGWRRYLFNAWKERSFLLAGPILGLVWAIWHLPTFFFYGSFWFNLICYLLFVPAIHFLQAWTYLKGKSLVAPILVHATYNAFATATGISGFMSSGRQPYQMSASDMVTKGGSNLLFFIALLPFAFLLAREMKVSGLPRAGLTCDQLNGPTRPHCRSYDAGRTKGRLPN